MANNYPTPHIDAKPEDFGKIILMPGDPLRSKFIAENFLTDIKLVNNVRGVQGYTGYYRGAEISVMASGMGIPSIGIYSYELFNFFDVDCILRIGSAGSMQETVKIGDIVIGQGACTDSNFVHQFNLPGTYSAIADYELLSSCVESAKENRIDYHVGNIYSADCFYGDNAGLPDYKLPLNAWSKMGVLAVEMEAAALYMNAARAGKKALAICTISDSLITGESLDALQRQDSFTEMMEVGLDTAVKMDRKFKNKLK